jgi:hypothetical protein
MEQALQEIKRMMAACHPFERVEAFIERCPRLDEEERSVLWLIAWMGREPSVIAAHPGRLHFG